MGKAIVSAEQYTPTATQRESWDRSIYPTILHTARLRVRRLPPHWDGWDFVQEVCAIAWKRSLSAWSRGLDPASWSITFARLCCSQVRRGDRACGKRGGKDLFWQGRIDRKRQLDDNLVQAISCRPSPADAVEIPFSVSHNPATDVMTLLDWEAHIAGLEVWEKELVARATRGEHYRQLEKACPREARGYRGHLERIIAAFLTR